MQRLGRTPLLDHLLIHRVRREIDVPRPCYRPMVHKRVLKKRGITQGRQYAAEFGNVQLHYAAGAVGEADEEPVARLRFNLHDPQYIAAAR